MLARVRKIIAADVLPRTRRGQRRPCRRVSLIQVFNKRAQAAEGHEGEVHLQYEVPFLFEY